MIDVLQTSNRGIKVKFRVEGADAHSGDDVVTEIEAPDSFHAQRIARDGGLLISSIRPAVEQKLASASLQRPVARKQGMSRIKKIVAGSILIIFIFPILILLLTSGQHDRFSYDPNPALLPDPPQPPLKPKPSRVTPEMLAGQPARETLIKKLQGGGAIGDLKVSNHVGKVEVSNAFLLSSFKDKEAIAGALYAWCVCEDPDCTIMVLKSEVTGKDVGRFGDAYGGLEMD